jgi:hypothetical protein
MGPALFGLVLFAAACVIIFFAIAPVADRSGNRQAEEFRTSDKNPRPFPSPLQ